MASGVQMRAFGGVYLFRFSDELQSRFEALLDRQKTTALTAEEMAEYAGISELQRIFTLINAQLVAKGEESNIWLQRKQATPLWQQVPATEIAQRLRERATQYTGSVSQGLPDAAFDRETIYGD
jgi:hypothetical protein